jgi:hypothetical protein
LTRLCMPLSRRRGIVSALLRFSRMRPPCTCGRIESAVTTCRTSADTTRCASRRIDDRHPGAPRRHGDRYQPTPRNLGFSLKH